MSILVAYGSKHGATQGIAERIAGKLREAGHEVDLRDAREAKDLERYDAFVVGSAIYMEHWRKPATGLVSRNSALLSARPVWLFSSGPLGTENTDKDGRDLRESTVPKEIAALTEAVRPHEHRVFFGALVPARLAVWERLLRKLPAGRKLLPDGDFRDWSEIEAWATEIASALATDVPRGGDG